MGRASGAGGVCRADADGGAGAGHRLHARQSLVRRQPFNSAHLLGIASAQNKYKDPNAVTSTDPAQQFLRTLQSRLLSSLATQITDIIFGENAQDSGLIQFGDQEISFVRGLDSVTLTITNNADGSVTEIVIPLLQGSDDGGLTGPGE